MINRQLSNLGISHQHLDQCRLPLEEEACTLADAGRDVFDRELLMSPETLAAWTKLRQAALEDNIELQVVSAFRSVEYQCDLFRRKLQRGISIDDILKVNAIPGYSEHHTGRALDLTTPDCPPLEQQFEATAAFSWLLENAERHSFYLSYPFDNDLGIDYEPWHWAFRQPV